MYSSTLPLRKEIYPQKSFTTKLMLKMNDYNSIIQIDDILVSGEILTEYFACDYEKCKGICCVIGDSGAPLLECELPALEKNYHHFSPIMSEAGRRTVDEKGFFEIDIDGDLVTPLVPDSEECAYCRRDADGNCLCTIEEQWNMGNGDFCKPISCRLYPIRVSKLSNGMTALNLHRWDICRDAFTNGRRKKIRVYQFLKTPLTHFFGEDFYSALDAAAKQLREA